MSRRKIRVMSAEQERTMTPREKISRAAELLQDLLLGGLRPRLVHGALTVASVYLASAAQAQEATVRLTLVHGRPDMSEAFCFYRGQAPGFGEFVLWTHRPLDLEPCPVYLDFPVEDLDDVPQFDALPGAET